MALVGFIIGMALLTKRARGQQAIAETESKFLSSIFEASTPLQARGKQVMARDLLDAGVQRVDLAGDESCGGERGAVFAGCDAGSD